MMPAAESKEEKNNNLNQPRDPPATSFEVEPILQALPVYSRGNVQPYFGLVVVCHWPPSPEFQKWYDETWLPTVRTCFDKADLLDGDEDNHSPPPSVYLYPSKYLHITIATLYPMKSISKAETDMSYEGLETQYSELLERASRRPDWPRQNFQIRLDRAQLGSKAGILLWKDLSGGIEQVRNCLKKEAQTPADQIAIHSIPSIVHSTFVRYAKVPSTPASAVQERFQQHCLPLAETFSKENAISVSNISLACERIPYMHIPQDEHHVLWEHTLDNAREEEGAS